MHQGVLSIVDRQTGTIWTHLDGRALRGPLHEERMTMVPIPQMTWAQWLAQHPATLVLSPDTPFRNRYRPVTIGVFNQSEALFGDARLPANALVVGVEVDGRFRAYPVEQLPLASGIVNDQMGAQPILVFYDPSARTGLAFSRLVDGQVLEFYNAYPEGFQLRDRQTDSLWDLTGHAVAGPLAGASLSFVPSFISEWYGWSGYHPQTTLYQALS